MYHNITLPNEYLKLFQGRTDVVGQAVEPISTAVESEEALLQRINEHINGTRRLGFYNLLPDGTSPWAMVEFEDHGHGKLDDPNQSSLDFLAHMKDAGISAYRERSKNAGDNCYHVWIFVEKPIAAKKLHIALKTFLQDAMGINTEVFPKGYDPASLGNFVWLPLFGGTDSWGLGVHDQRTVFIDENGVPHPDQMGFIKGIQRVSEGVFDTFIQGYKLVSKTFDKLPINDLSKVRQCSFMKHCEEHAEALPEPLWYAWITNAVTCIGGREYIHEYSSKHPNYSRRETEKKIAHAMNDTGPMLHETIAGLGFTCDCPAKFKAPVSRSNYVDVQAEVSRIKGIADMDQRAIEIRKLIAYWQKLDAVEKDLYRKMLQKELGLSSGALNIGLHDQRTGIDYSQDIKDIWSALDNADDVEWAKILFTWLKERGAQYFTDETENHYIYWNKKLILMQEHSGDFESLLLSKADVSTATQFGRIVVQVMNASAHAHGRRIKQNTWLQSDRKNLTVYLNLKNNRNELVKIDPIELRVIQNGDNGDGVFMLDTANNKIEPIEYHPMNGEQVKNALAKAEELIVRHTPAAEHDRWLSYGWVLSYPLYDFTNNHFILRYQCSHEKGKSTATRLQSYWVYGKDCLNVSATVASSHSDASVNPLVLDDNVESRSFFSDPGRMTFYLGAGTGGSKQKRDKNTASGNITETIRALVLCNGIESIAKSELTSRMMIIKCDRDLYNSNFTSAVFLEIERYRDDLQSANFVLTQRVLKRMQEGAWQDIQERLQREYPKHPKNRMFEHLAIIILYLEEFFKAAGKPDDVWALLDLWMGDQKELALNEIIGGDPIIQGIDLLRDSAVRQNDIESTFHPQDTQDEIRLRNMIKLDVKALLGGVSVSEGGRVEMTGYAGEILSALANAYKVHYNQNFPISNARVLSNRLDSVKKELTAHGYQVTEEFSKKKKQTKYTITYTPFGAGEGGSRNADPPADPPGILGEKVAKIE